MYPYKVSVIMPVYNVELFLCEAIDSVIQQDIGLANIQLILVDDGSTDGSGAICDRYAAAHPENIQVIHKENGGVSSARNLAIEHIRGEYVNFLDSDDKLSSDALRKLADFMDANRMQVDVVAFPMQFFDGQTGNHILNYKFNRGSRVIDLDKEWQNPQLSMSSAMVKAEKLRQYRFDPRLSYAEDAKVMQMLLAQKRAMGVVSGCCYWYRRRTVGEESSIQASFHRKGWYLPYMEYFQKKILDYYREKLGYVPRFLQNTLMYDLQWRLKLAKIPEDILSAEEKETYFTLLSQILSRIDEDVIMAQKNIFREHKLLALALKYGRRPEQLRSDHDISLRYQADARFKVSEFPLKLEFMELREDACVIDAEFAMLPDIPADAQVIACVGEEEYSGCRTYERQPILGLDQEIQNLAALRFTIPLQSGRENQIRFLCQIGDSRIPLRVLSFGGFFPVSFAYASMYYSREGWLLTCGNQSLVLTPWQKSLEKEKKKAFIRELWSKNRPGSRKAALLYCVLDTLKRWKRRPLWLISDRVMKAGDNGEAFFRYMRTEQKQIDTRFVISGKSPDYAVMKKVGPVLKRESLGYKVCMLLSDWILSSSAEAETYNPFHGYSEPYRPRLADTRFVFLQHGVTKDDLSGWLKRPNKNLAGFVTTAVPEADSVLNGAYEYTDRQVWLTGFPRFARLYRDDQRWITIMPTWRKYLMGQWDQKTDIWSLAPNAAESQYVKFYNSLLNSPELLQAAQKYGYRLKFLPHPNFQSHLDIFHHNSQVDFLGREVAYRDIYAKSDLIITDYSSVVFDFAYLRKPIVYTHFDSADFFAGEHVYSKGYFDYERDGFGEVRYDLESTVAQIIEYMKNGCQLKDTYRQRIDGFFAFDDQQNCRRVYERLMEAEAISSSPKE